MTETQAYRVHLSVELLALIHPYSNNFSEQLEPVFSASCTFPAIQTRLLKMSHTQPVDFLPY